MAVAATCCANSGVPEPLPLLREHVGGYLGSNSSGNFDGTSVDNSGGNHGDNSGGNPGGDSDDNAGGNPGDTTGSNSSDNPGGNPGGNADGITDGDPDGNSDDNSWPDEGHYQHRDPAPGADRLQADGLL
jgi:hypothetical protein